jgi:excisionase family DNA binding protein
MNRLTITVNKDGLAAKPQHRQRVSVRLLTVRQAADYLGTTTATLYTKVWRREVPFIKLGRSVRFDVVDLDEMIEQAKVRPREFSVPGSIFERR